MAEWALISALLTFKLDLHCHMELFGIQHKTRFLSLFFFFLFLDNQPLGYYYQSLKMTSQWLLVSTTQFLPQSWSLFSSLLGTSEFPCVCSTHKADTPLVSRSLPSSLEWHLGWSQRVSKGHRGKCKRTNVEEEGCELKKKKMMPHKC